MGMTSGDESTAPPSPLGGLADSLTSDARTWSVSPGLVSVRQVTPSGLTLLFRTARRMRAAVRPAGGGAGGLGGRTLATVFYEASTRTACSFQAEQESYHRLGVAVQIQQVDQVESFPLYSMRSDLLPVEE